MASGYAKAQQAIFDAHVLSKISDVIVNVQNYREFIIAVRATDEFLRVEVSTFQGDPDITVLEHELEIKLDLLLSKYIGANGPPARPTIFIQSISERHNIYNRPTIQITLE